jgi:hypothetical protein
MRSRPFFLAGLRGKDRSFVVEIEERFLSAQADAFAGSERKEKVVGLLRSE